MKTRKILLAIAIVCVSTCYSFADAPSIPQQLKDLINKAFDNYPKLKQGGEFVKLGEQQNKLATAAYMPIIDGDASYRFAKPTPTLSFPIGPNLETFAFFPANNYDLHVGLTQSIWDFGRTQASVKKTLAQIQTSKDNLEGAKENLAMQVAEIYCAIVFLNKSVDVENDQIKLLGETEKIISDRLKDGDALKFDLLSTQVKKNNALNLLIDLQTNSDKQYELLDMLTGMEGKDYITAKEIDFNSLPHFDVSIDNNYDLLVLNDQLKASEWDIKSAKAEWLPSLVARAQLGTQNGYVPTVDKMEFAYSAGVGLHVPIFSAARPNYLTKIAQINLQAAKYNIEAQKINVTKDMLQAKSDIVAIESKIKNYELQIDQAKEALNLANIRYRNGIITNLELLSAQTDVQNAELGKIQLQFTLLQAHLQVIQLGGTKFW